MYVYMNRHLCMYITFIENFLLVHLYNDAGMISYLFGKWIILVKIEMCVVDYPQMWEYFT